MTEARPPEEGEEYMTMQEAADRLGVSRFQVSRLVSRLKIPVYERPADRRIRLLSRADVEQLAKPQRRQEIGQPPKMADAA
jgi:excisionase family DNA binding protein